jgi:outer membrane murein-binding lipoprotein Lpp
MDAYDIFDRAERANERAADLNRETAAECDGISPANVPVWSSLRVENMDGTTNINATINAICTHVRTLNEAAADAIREISADREAVSDVAAQYGHENERLRERVTNAETLLRAVREDWDRSSTGMIRLQLDLLLGNPELRQAA